jgi:predicted nucleotidyltransferase component of viral defense system
LLGLVDSKLRDLLAFKGGTALKKIYFPDYRYSEDLDFTLLKTMDKDAIIEGFRMILREIAKSQAFQFDMTDKKIEKRSDSLTFYVDYVGPLQGRLDSRDIKVDVTFEEMLAFPLIERPIISPYSDSRELGKNITAYSLEEVMTEKLCALIGRTEPRDLYDLRFLFEVGSIDYRLVAHAFPEKARNKHVEPKRLARILNERRATLARLWESRLAHQVDDLPHLDATIRQVNKGIRQLGLP